VGEVAKVVAKIDAKEKAIYEGAFPILRLVLHSLGYLRPTKIESLSTRRKQRMTAGMVRELANRDGFEFAKTVETNNRELLDELANEPIPETEASAA
jgi:hypothetical protein